MYNSLGESCWSSTRTNLKNMQMSIIRYSVQMRKTVQSINWMWMTWEPLI